MRASIAFLVIMLAATRAGAQPDGGEDGGVPPSNMDAGAQPDAGADGGVPPFEDAGTVETDDEDLLTITIEESEQIEAEEPDAPATPISERDLRVGEIVIAYSPEDVLRLGGSAHLVLEDQLAAFSYEDPNQIVLQVPGLYVRQEDGFGLRPNIGVRGVSSDRSQKITLMEDGVLFAPAPYSAPAAYYFPLMPRVVGVEAFKGPASILYGPNTIGGAINFLTRGVPEENGGEIDLSFGRFWSRRIHFHYGARNDWGGFIIEGVDLGSDGYKEIDNSDDSTGFHRGEYTITGLVHSDPMGRVYHELEARVGFSRERSYETYTGLTDEDFHENPYRRYPSTALDRMDWWRTQARLRYRLSIGEHVELVTTLYRNDFDRAWRRLNRFRDGPELLDVLTSPSGLREVYYDVLRGAADSASVSDPTQDQEDLMIVTNARRFVSEGVQMVARIDAQTGPIEHDLELGLRVHHDQVRRDHVERDYRMQNGQLVRASTDEFPTTDQLASSIAVAAHVVYGLTYRGLTLTPGLRLEHIQGRLDDDLVDDNTRGEETIVLPGLGLSYEFVDNWAAFAGVHRGFSPVAPGRADEVDPELSINYEVGLRFSAHEGEQAMELTGFYNDYSNLVGECGGSSGCPPELLDRQFNGGEVRVFGLEAAGTYSFDLGRGLRLPILATYTFTHATFRTEFNSENPLFGDVIVGDEVPYVPMHQARLQIGIEHEDWEVNTSMTYVGAMREEAGQGSPEPGELPKTDDYVLMDLAASYQAFERLRFTLRFDNLLNTQAIVARCPFGARPQAPFSVQAGLRISL